LRHEPDVAGISLDGEGWATIKELLQALKAAGFSINREGLLDLVRSDEKRRYALSADRRRIRANHGHSVQIELKLKSEAPPDVLYHGTARSALQGIRMLGIKRQRRLYVHLSSEQSMAWDVGRRRGGAVILRVRAGMMHAQGHAFFRSENGIWLTDHVPSTFIDWDGLIFEEITPDGSGHS
jgi:putative RNA 2'-phosphotransferase